jgi:hypothetical protein
VPKLRLIVGQGTAAESFRATADPQGWHTVVVGPRGLWAVLPQAHRMGQPAHLLQLQGQPVPGFQTANGQTPAGLNQFLDVATYQQGLLALAQANDAQDPPRPVTVHGALMNLPQCRVTYISRGPASFVLVTLAGPNNAHKVLMVDQVVICSGIGVQQTPQSAGIQVVGQPPAQNMIFDGIDYLTAPALPNGAEVVMYGGGATSAWVADMARARNPRSLTWIARPGGSGFNGCVLPGHRNFQVMQATANNRIRAIVQQVSFLPAMQRSGRQLRGAKVRVQIQQDGRQRVLLADQFIYSIGGDLAGPQSLRQLIAPNLLAEVAPIRDSGRVVSDGTGVVALGTSTRSLLIVGAATYNITAPHLQNRQAAPMVELPLNAQVPDGIAVAVSSVSALNNRIGMRQLNNGQVVQNTININTGNRNEIAALVATRYPDLAAPVANVVVEAIIGWRSAANRQFGIDPADLDHMVGELLGV